MARGRCDPSRLLCGHPGEQRSLRSHSANPNARRPPPWRGRLAPAQIRGARAPTSAGVAKGNCNPAVRDASQRAVECSRPLTVRLLAPKDLCGGETPPPRGGRLRGCHLQRGRLRYEVGAATGTRQCSTPFAQAKRAKIRADGVRRISPQEHLCTPPATVTGASRLRANPRGQSAHVRRRRQGEMHRTRPCATLRGR